VSEIPSILSVKSVAQWIGNTFVIFHIWLTESNPVAGSGRLFKDPTANRPYRNLRRLENHLIAIAKEWTTPEKIHSLIHGWMRTQGAGEWP
jgi:hypothetical protein